jgi:hypothetical protein
MLVKRLVLRARELPPFAIKTIETSIESSNPQCADFIFVNCPNRIVTQAMRIVEIVAVMNKLSGFCYQTIEPASKYTNP